MTMSKRWTTALLATVLIASLPVPPAAAQEKGELGEIGEIKLDPVVVEGLQESVRVRRDQNDIPHIFALNDHDALFMMGWLHARDRLFQMDLLRRVFSGTAAELVGEIALVQDTQFRTFGLRRAAEETFGALSAESQAWLEAYTAGVNAFLDVAPLPVEYAILELTKASVPEWTVIDSLTITKGLAFGLSFGLDELDFTTALLTFQGVGAIAGFDGVALFFEDLYRSAPFDPSISIPEPPPISATSMEPPYKALAAPDYLNGRTLNLLEQYRERLEAAPVVAEALKRGEQFKGSNWWMAAGDITESGHAMIASDPHLALDTPATFYEVHLRVRSNGDEPMNIFGVSFPGAPAIALGCNPWICWGGTVNPMDVTDLYQETVIVDPQTFLPQATVFEGQQEPVVIIPQSYQVNQVGDQELDNLVDGGVGPLEGGLTVVVPRRNNGPLVAVDVSDPSNIIGLSVQYTGWRATRELDAFRIWARARGFEDFRTGVQFFDFGSQNWSVADTNGNIAYFTSAEMPIREDLQNLNFPDGGVPPWIVRDGTHGLQHEWMQVQNPQPEQSLGFEILPFAEMPQEVNPLRGYILNANNDPIGTTLDNNPLNQVRPGGQGLYYLSPGYATGFRMGRIQQLFDDALAGGGPLTMDDFKAFQANNQLLDAEVLVPYIADAFANAGAEDAPTALAALAADAGVVEAVGRLTAWDFSTPTGIPQGYDPGDDPFNLPEPSADEIAASVAATIYSAWRGQFVQAVIDDTLAGLGIDDLAPGSNLAMSAVRNLLDTFDTQQGVGVSGVPFFDVGGAFGEDPATPADARDYKILKSLRDALDLLASDDFAAAFGNSSNQDDYRWGYLHRIVFDHPFGFDPFSIPNGGGIVSVSPDLPGVARSGGLGAVDASSHGARADGVNDFMFGSGPSRRLVAVMDPAGVDADQVIPGGESGDLGSPFQSDQLLLWLVNGYHGVHITPADVVGNSVTYQRFLPMEEAP